MMTVTLRIALILVSLGSSYLLLKKIRQSRLQIESTISWILIAMVLVLFSIFPQAADWCAHLLGIYATTNFLFLFMIFVLLVKIFYMTIRVSQLETRVKELVQQIALEKKEREETSAQPAPAGKKEE